MRDAARRPSPPARPEGEGEAPVEGDVLVPHVQGHGEVVERVVGHVERLRALVARHPVAELPAADTEVAYQPLARDVAAPTDVVAAPPLDAVEDGVAVAHLAAPAPTPGVLPALGLDLFLDERIPGLPGLVLGGVALADHPAPMRDGPAVPSGKLVDGDPLGWIDPPRTHRHAHAQAPALDRGGLRGDTQDDVVPPGPRPPLLGELLRAVQEPLPPHVPRERPLEVVTRVCLAEPLEQPVVYQPRGRVVLRPREREPSRADEAPRADEVVVEVEDVVHAAAGHDDVLHLAHEVYVDPLRVLDRRVVRGLRRHRVSHALVEVDDLAGDARVIERLVVRLLPYVRLLDERPPLGVVHPAEVLGHEPPPPPDVLARAADLLAEVLRDSRASDPHARRPIKEAGKVPRRPAAEVLLIEQAHLLCHLVIPSTDSSRPKRAMTPATPSLRLEGLGGRRRR